CSGRCVAALDLLSSDSEIPVHSSKERHMMIKPHLVVVAVLMSMLVAGAVRETSGAPPTSAPAEGVPAQLTGIQQDISLLQTSVNFVSEPDQSNVRFTPPLSTWPGGFVQCFVVNVTSVNQTVKVDLLKFDGSQGRT